MSIDNLPVTAFKMATVRAPRKPVAEEDNARRIQYALNSTLHGVLSTDRAGADPRTDMIASAENFIATDPLHIEDLAGLKGLFTGFDLVNDYLRVKRKNGSKADLKTLIEGPQVLNEPATDYVADAGYDDLRSRVWDNIFALTILGADTALRTEMVLIIRLLNVIEKVAADDPLLDTGAGIYSAYKSLVLLPKDVFPMPNVPLPEEPETQDAQPDPIPVLQSELEQLRRAYLEIKQAYRNQTYSYKGSSKNLWTT